MLNRLRSILALLFVLSAPEIAPNADAGPNEGFTFSLEPTQIVEPLVGDTFEVTLSIQGAVEAKGTLIQAQYDASVLEPKSVTGGTLIPGMIAFILPKGTGDDGLDIVESGGTQLGGTPGSGDGTLGTITFEVIGDLPVEGTFISLLEVQLNNGAQEENKDRYTFSSGERGVSIARNFTNRIFDLEVATLHNRAILRWRTLFAGINDRVRFRPAGSEEAYQTARNPLLDGISDNQLEALALLRDLEVDLDDEAAVLETLNEFFGELPSTFVERLREVNETVNRFDHSIPLPNLEPGTAYEYTAISIGLDGDLSAPTSGTFRTRIRVDNRPLTVTRFDSQTTATSATFRWQTNRPADTRVTITRAGSDEVRDRIIDTDGSISHVVNLSNLRPGTEYLLAVSSRLVGVDQEVESGLLTEEQITLTRRGTFRTKARVLPVRFTRRPRAVVGPTTAVAVFSFNQIASVRVDYGPVANFAGKVTQESTVDERQLYTESVFSTNIVDKHSFTLNGLDPATEYRYRITATTPDGHLVTTDPRGNEQWSRDLRFTTSNAADTNEPVITNGPQVKTFGRGGALIWYTDVPTIGVLYYGTVGANGTLGTPDEFQLVDTGADGFPRFRRRHRVVVTGLELDTSYGYRIESTGANGQTSVFNPQAAAAAKTLQPPGGGGSFTTRNQIDTQFPVILSGPTVTGKSHDTAIIEWTTDESASSQARFTRLDSAGAAEENVSDGDISTSHRLVLSNLKPGVAYSYVVGSTDAIGNGATESVASVVTTDDELDLDPPTITDGPEVVYKNDRSATITWKTDEDASGQISFGTAADQLDFIRSELNSSKDHSITLTNLDADTEYFFTVSSLDLNNNGPSESAISSFTTDALPDLDSPSLSNVYAIPFRNRAIIRWRTNEIADSFVDFGQGGNALGASKTTQDRVSAFFQEGGTLDQQEGDIEDVTEHEITLTNLEAGTTYFYTVGSTDPSNNPFTESEVLSFETPLDDDTTSPSPPQGVAATPGPSQVVLNWLPNAEEDFGTYTVQRRGGDTGTFVSIVTGLEEPSYTDGGLENGTLYQYQIIALDRAAFPNASEPSELAEATPSASAGPQPPADLSASGENFLQPLLSFDNSTPFVADADLTYTIQMSTRDDFSNVTASIADLAEDSGNAGSGRTAWQIDRELEEGVAYFWRVRAVEGAIFGDFSEAVQYIAQAAPLLAGDFTGDNTVDFDDFFLFVDFFGQTATGDAVPFDLDGDGEIGFGDFFQFVDNFGKTATGKQWAAGLETDAAAAVELEASGGTRAEDGIVTLAVRASDVRDLKAFGLVLGFNPAAVELVEARPGDGHLLGSDGGQAPLFGVLTQSNDELVLGNGLTRGEPVDGSGLLAEVDFRLKGSPNEAYFDLRDVLVARSGTQVKRVAALHSTRLKPRDFHLGVNFPNPFNPSTTIEYALPRAGAVSLQVYDVLGQRVRTLLHETDHPLGFYRLEWDGRDQMGRPVGSGLYFYRLATPDFTRTHKMTLLK